MQFFVKSHLLSQDSKVLAQAVNECSNIAELYDSSDNIADALSLLKANYPKASVESSPANQAVLYYDPTFSPCEKADASYTLKAAFTEEDTMLKAKIQVTDSEDSMIYELNTDHHTARRTGYEER